MTHCMQYNIVFLTFPFLSSLSSRPMFHEFYYNSFVLFYFIERDSRERGGYIFLLSFIVYRPAVFYFFCVYSRRLKSSHSFVIPSSSRILIEWISSVWCPHAATISSRCYLYLFFCQPTGTPFVLPTLYTTTNHLLITSPRNSNNTYMICVIL
eukprot:GHVO01035150.1.p1 GENE.GHVO01035150.1~~GHVO01035150.1.p1  ORF type:complete len:153 (-),score=0.27 GHVO01035150.1:22-480(-)